MRFGLSSLFAVAALAALAACANQYDLATVETEVPRTSGPVAITVIERRGYVLAGTKPPSFVGLQQLGVGEPLDVTTSSGQPLSDDVAEALAAAFYGQQTETWVVRSSFGDTAQDAFREFLASPSDSKWEPLCFGDVGTVRQRIADLLAYNVSVSVHGRLPVNSSYDIPVGVAGNHLLRQHLPSVA